MRYAFWKRLFDIVLSGLALVVLSPVLLLTVIAIKLDSKGPAIFAQKRLGLHGREFTFYKFRSMCPNAEAKLDDLLDQNEMDGPVFKIKDDPRITRVGKFIRKTSIDELPQLWNILKGDMSIVGPRPPLTYHPWPIGEYTEEQRHMFDVRPGITGWAQVNGRKAVEWHKRIEMNVWYTRNYSLFLDIKILFMTVFKVLTNADNVNDGATLK